MDDLVQFLRDRLDKDERDALAAAAERGPVWWYEPGPNGQVLAGEILDGGSAAIRSLAMTTRSDAEGEHAARHDPARVLREVEAKRKIVDHVAHELDDPGSGNPWWYADRLTPILKALALPYSDHPGYRDDWRP